LQRNLLAKNEVGKGLEGREREKKHNPGIEYVILSHSQALMWEKRDGL